MTAPSRDRPTGERRRYALVLGGFVVLALAGGGLAYAFSSSGSGHPSRVESAATGSPLASSGSSGTTAPAITPTTPATAPVTTSTTPATAPVTTPTTTPPSQPIATSPTTAKPTARALPVLHIAASDGDHGFSGRYPSTIDFSLDAGNIVRRLSWTSWGSTQAVGKGSVEIQSCVPDCATGSETPEPVTLVLSSPSGGSFRTITEKIGGPSPITTVYHYGQPNWPIAAS